MIGVAGDTHQVSLESGTRPEVLRPMVDYTYLTLAVRTAADPASLTSAIKQQVWPLDKDLPAYDVETMQEVVEDNLGQRRFDSFLMAIFGGLALLLAAAGNLRRADLDGAAAHATRLAFAWRWALCPAMWCAWS